MSQSLHVPDLIAFGIEPVLRDFDLYSENAVNLILGTIAVESNMGRYYYQVNGPAIGIGQMEPNTYMIKVI